MRAEFNHDLLRIARQARGLTQAELAERSRASKASISKLENGVIGPTDRVLDNLSGALEFPKEFFYQDDHVVGLPMNVQYRRRTSVKKKLINRLEAELNIRILHIRHLLSAPELELKPDLLLPSLDVDAYDSNPERVAEVLRRTWGLPSGPIRHLVSLVERAGCLVMHFDSPGLKVDAFTAQIPEMPPCIFMNQKMSADRQRFSLAHELGHIVMHRYPSTEMEEQANRFAAEFLMPADDIREHFSDRLSLQELAELKPVWRVSMVALLSRAEALHVSSPSHIQYLWRQMSVRGYRKAEPVNTTLDREEPIVFPNIAQRNLEKVGGDSARLAADLKSNEADIERFYGISKDTRHLRIVR